MDFTDHNKIFEIFMSLVGQKIDTCGLSEYFSYIYISLHNLVCNKRDKHVLSILMFHHINVFLNRISTWWLESCDDSSSNKCFKCKLNNSKLS